MSNNKSFVKSNLLEIQIAQHHFNSKTFYKKQRTTGGMPHLKPIDLDMTKHSDHYVWKDTSERVVRRCDDTVEQEASEFLCTKTPLLEESWATKNMNKKNWNCSLRRATNVLFSKFRGWRRKTALRAVSKNHAVFLLAGVLVRKNSLASCQRCRHSVEPRALTCTFKHSDLIAWSLLSWHPTHKYFRGKLCF